MLRNKTYLIFFFSLVSLLSFAQDKVPGVIVELASNEIVEFRISDNPKMTFDGQIVKITTNDIEINYDLPQIARVRMGEIDDIMAISSLEKTDGNFEIDKDFIRLNGFHANDVIKIYSITGTILSTQRFPNSGTILLQISSIPKGISIIKVNNNSIKITKQ